MFLWKSTLVSRKSSYSQKGFSLVEVLVVVVIIVILGAISTPIFFGQKSKTQDATLSYDAHNLITQAKVFQPAGSGSMTETPAVLAVKLGATWSPSSKNRLGLYPNCAIGANGASPPTPGEWDSPGNFVVWGYVTRGTEGTFAPNTQTLVFDSKTGKYYWGSETLFPEGGTPTAGDRCSGAYFSKGPLA